MVWKIMKWIVPILLILMAVLFSIIAEPVDGQGVFVAPNPSNNNAGSSGAMRF